jgi:hypothetical protein
MSIEQFRTQVIANIWQAIAQSKVDLSSVPQNQQVQFVERIADQTLITLNSLLDEVAAADPEAKVEEVNELDEKVLWTGRPFISLVEHYAITSDRLKIVRGLLSRKTENFELIRVQDIDYSQGLHERILGIGDIKIRGHDPSNPEIVLRNVPDPDKVYELLRKTWLEARKRHGLQFREYM